jgi:hypothetical protein
VLKAKLRASNSTIAEAADDAARAALPR